MTDMKKETMKELNEAADDKVVDVAVTVNDEATAREDAEVVDAEAANDAEAAGADDGNDRKEVDEEATGAEAVDIEQLIAEAEARGYERGRNEGIEAWMNEGRGVYAAEREADGDGEVMILNNMRRSVWDV